MKSIYEVVHSMINEAFRNKDFERVLQIIDQYLNKYNIYSYPFGNHGDVDGKRYSSYILWTPDNTNCALLLYDGDGNSTELSWVGFGDNVDNAIYSIMNGGTYKFVSNLYVKGAPINRILPIIKDVMNGKIRMTQRDIDKQIDSIYESLITESDITSMYWDELEKERKKVYTERRKLTPGSPKWIAANQRYEEIKQQRKVLQMKAKASTTVKFQKPEEDKVEDKFEERVDWHERYKDMEAYIDMVIDGIKPLTVICGAPGVGKTFRVKKHIRKAGKVMSKGPYKLTGEDWYMSKGSETKVSLYCKLFQYKDKGDIFLLDDCDKVLKDEDAINLIKAATDSDDERIIAYGTSRPPEMPDTLIEMHPEWAEQCIQDNKGKYYYPPSFEYNGSMIILTNMTHGQLDTAIRNRGLLCNLDFTIEEMLDIIRELSPFVKPEVLTPESKEKAIEFLIKMNENGEDVQISIRSFETCAGFFVRCDDSVACGRRIREQMKLQFANGGKRY